MTYVSNEADLLFLEQLREQEEAERHGAKHYAELHGLAWNGISGSSSSSSSSSSASSSSEEAEECSYARHYMENLAFTPNLSAYELSHLVTSTKDKKKAGPEQTLLVASENERISEEDRKRVKLKIVDPRTNVYIDVMIENYVYVTYFCNKYTKEKYHFNLNNTAIKLMAYGVLLSKNKFTKVTIKYADGPSHYFFGSGAMVESGTENPKIARATHNMSVRLLKEVCHHESIEVQERKCQNIVAKGTLKFGICLMLLKHKHPSYVQYTEKFSGAIIRLNKIDSHKKNRQPSVRHYKKRRLSSSSYDMHEEEEEEEVEDDYGLEFDQTPEEDEEEEEEEDPTSLFFGTPWRLQRSTSNGSSSEEENSGDDESSYEHYEVTNEDKACNEGFAHLPIQPELLAKQSASKEFEKRTLKNKQLWLDMEQDPDQMDMYQVAALTQKKNITILVFEKGRVICAGCKSRDGIIKSFAKVLPILASCRDTAENKAIEADLIRKSKGT